MHGKNKHQSRESRAKVREILMRHWDPIGIRDREGYEDEYDDYIGKVYVMLMDECATAPAISAFLFDIASRYMGLGNKPALLERSSETAAILVRMRPEFETH